MRSLVLSLFATALCLGAVRAADAQAIPGPGPQQLIETVSQDMLRDIDANRAALRKDPGKLRALVDKNLLPHFDTDYAARLVLGKHWRTATPDQQKRFIDAFFQSLMRHYGDAMLDFTGDRLKILPFKGDPAATMATVRTEVKRDNGTPVPVNYSCAPRRRAGRPGTSPSKASRTSRTSAPTSARRSTRKGLDAVIQRLETENTAAGKAPASKAPAKAG